MNSKIFPLVLALIIFYQIGCRNQSQELSATAYVVKSLEYAGDIGAEDLSLSIQVICPEGMNRGQSLRPDPPYNEYRIETRFEIDRTVGKELAQFISPFNGFIFGGYHVLSGDKYTAYDNISSTARDLPNLGFENYRHFPHTYLQRALKDSANLVYEGLSPFRDQEAHVIKLAGDRYSKFFIDPDNYALLEVELQAVNHPYGDGLTVKKYYDYKEFGTLRFPTKFQSGGVYESWGTLFNYYEIGVLDQPIQLPDLDSFRVLAGDYSEAKLVSLAENIYMIQNIGNDRWGIFDYNVLVAEFEEYIMMGEAPISNNASIRAIEMVTEKFPDKPIKYLVQSHHHSDHVGGLREYIAREIELVVPEAIQELITRIAEATWDAEPDTQAAAKKDPIVVPVTDPIAFKDDLNEALVLNIGPIPHVNDMLAIYFPKQELVWQVDMIAYKEWPLSLEPSVIFQEQLRDLGWSIKTIAGEHGRVLDGQALVDYLSP